MASMLSEILYVDDLVFILGREALNGFSGCSVPTLSSQFFSPHFFNVVVELKASGPPHVFELWLGVSKVMLPVEYFCSNKASFVLAELNEDYETATKMRFNLATQVLGVLSDLKQWCLSVRRWNQT